MRDLSPVLWKEFWPRAFIARERPLERPCDDPDRAEWLEVQDWADDALVALSPLMVDDARRAELRLMLERD